MDKLQPKLSHPNEQPLSTMEKAGFLEKVGAENIRPHIDDALKRAAAVAEQS